jgi:hypothetical protein
MSSAPKLFGMALNSKDTSVAPVRKLNRLSFDPPGLADPARFFEARRGNDHPYVFSERTKSGFLAAQESTE